ncbi:HAD-IA family hydrolase [Microbacterium halophytorum]|uniref:HAD-IA family hydrolase n=1 Tax=Microbacterium halophytorum TaxID=2067568 RepID=UPI000CFB8018|nr:HAD-IA family hydrolase [Microbacterium halophytorum]
MEFEADAALFDVNGTLLRFGRALPGAVDLVSALPKHRWAIVTTALAAGTSPRLAAQGFPLPDVVIGGEDVTVGKPDPEGYLLAASRLGVDPARCVVFEDTVRGVSAGRAAGATVVAIATTRPAAQLSRADAVVDSLTGIRIEVTLAGSLLVRTSP